MASVGSASIGMLCPDLSDKSVLTDSSFGYGGANAHCVLDEAHTFIEGDELLNGQNGIIEPPTSVYVYYRIMTH